MLLLVVLSLVFCSALIQAQQDVALGATCTQADDTRANCADVNAVCTATGTTCTCKSGYSQSGGTCSKIAVGKVGAACSSTDLCNAKNSSCQSNFCQCDPGFTGDKDDDHCTPDVGKIGGSCKATGSTCDDTTNAKCDANACTCNDGYTAVPGATICDQDPNNQQGGATVTSFSSLLYFFVAMTSLAAVIAQ